MGRLWGWRTACRLGWQSDFQWDSPWVPSSARAKSDRLPNGGDEKSAIGFSIVRGTAMCDGGGEAAEGKRALHFQQ